MDSGIDIVEGFKEDKKMSDQENGRLNNLSPKALDEGVFHLDYNSDLDLNSIEDDLF